MKDQKYIELLERKLKLREARWEEIHNLSRAIEDELREYEKAHPEMKDYWEENLMEARIQYQGDRIKRFFGEELTDFRGSPEKIPDIPVLPVQWLRLNVWPGLFRCGAIPKTDLEVGREYMGSSRNTTKATWTGKVFRYTRHKFTGSYEETVPHFQDDTGKGEDLFIPVYEK